MIVLEWELTLQQLLKIVGLVCQCIVCLFGYIGVFSHRKAAETMWNINQETWSSAVTHKPLVCSNLN